MTKQCANSAVPIYFAVFALFYAVLPGAGGTEVKSYDWECSEAKQVCSWREAVVMPPKGWIEDEGWTRHYQALVLFENGDKSVKKPVMFLRAHNGDGELTLEEYIGVTQDRLKKRAGDTSIEPLPDFKRAGQAGLQGVPVQDALGPGPGIRAHSFREEHRRCGFTGILFFPGCAFIPKHGGDGKSQARFL